MEQGWLGARGVGRAHLPRRLRITFKPKERDGLSCQDFGEAPTEALRGKSASERGELKLKGVVGELKSGQEWEQ